MGSSIDVRVWPTVYVAFEKTPRFHRPTLDAGGKNSADDVLAGMISSSLLAIGSKDWGNLRLNLV